MKDGKVYGHWKVGKDDTLRYQSLSKPYFSTFWKEANLSKENYYNDWVLAVPLAQTVYTPVSPKIVPIKGAKSTPKQSSGKPAKVPNSSTTPSYSKAKYDCNCFTAGTKVQTDEGEKPIEEIEVGDKVLSKDDETGEIAYKEVEWLYQRDVEETYNISVGGEVITTTDEHPFWIVGKGWVESKNLEEGDVLTTSDGKELAIEKIEVKKEHKTVYNFKVKDFHTYFVSNLGIWTHNSCGWVRMTTKQSTDAAKKLGCEPTNYTAKNGEKIYYNKKTKTYISQDIGSGDGSGPHNGGVWKMAKSPEALNKKDTRMGTYDGNLNRIGD